MKNKKELYIIKRDGHKEVLDISKVHKMTEAACEDLNGVSSSEVEMNSGLQFTDGMTTNEIQEILIMDPALDFFKLFKKQLVK